jgi:hypothetical protein
MVLDVVHLDQMAFVVLQDAGTKCVQVFVRFVRQEPGTVLGAVNQMYK